MSDHEIPRNDPADRTMFVVPATQFEEFAALLDAERETPRLAALLAAPSPFAAKDPS